MGNSDYVMKLEAAEAKLQELKTNVATMGKEAGAAMAAVEGQQQRLTLQRLISMVIYCYIFVSICFSFILIPTVVAIYFCGNYVVVILPSSL